MTWPQVDLDPVRRLRVLGAALPNSGFVERVIDAPFDLVWGIASDLENVPRFDSDLRSVRILERSDDRYVVSSTTRFGARSRLDVELRPGWCWMRDRRNLFVVGMAAVAEGDRTRYAHLEGTPRRGLRVFRPLFRHLAGGDVEGLARCAAEDLAPGAGDN